MQASAFVHAKANLELKSLVDVLASSKAVATETSTVIAASEGELCLLFLRMGS